jgi:hypothetical protein
MNTQDFTQLNLEDRKKNIDFFSDIADEYQIKFYYDELDISKKYHSIWRDDKTLNFLNIMKEVIINKK